MPQKISESSILATLQDLLIFQMALAGVPQKQIRHAVGLDMNRINRIAKLAKKPQKTKEE
jgi:hypothetical protein